MTLKDDISDNFAGCPLRLEMLENEPFSEFDWNTWKTIGFSPALAGKAGILFLDVIIIIAELDEK